MSQGSSGKKLIQNSIIYSLSGVLIKCFSFFLVPLYTAYLTTEDYGITSIATSFNGAMVFVVSFSLFSAVKRFYVEYKDDPEKLKRFYGSVCSFVFLSGTVICGLLTIFRDALSKYVFAGVDYYPVIFVCLIALVFSCEHTVFDYILKSQQKAGKSAIASIIYFLITVCFNILFIAVFKMGALGSLLATLLGYIVYTLYFAIEMLVKKEIKLCLDRKLLGEALKYSVPIMPHNLSTHIAALISKVFIGGVASLSAVGVYSIAIQFGAIADTVHSYISQAYEPWLYERLHEKETGYKKTIRNLSKMLCAVIGLFLLGIALFSHDYVVLLVDKAYVEAWRYVPLIVLIYAVKTMYYFYVQVLFYYKNASRMLFTATLSGSLLNIILSYFMIPIMGVYGSILADGIAMVVRVGIIVIISTRFDNIGLKIGDFVKNFLIVAAFIGFGMIPSFLKFGNTFSLTNFGYKIAVVIVYILLLLVRNRQVLHPYILRIKKKRKGDKSVGID